MTRFLVFTLAAPLMAFGDVAPGERRVSAARPSHSALTGMMAAALGLTRDDPRQDGLGRSLAFAIRVDASGAPLVDYHTTQTAPARRNRRFATRREALTLPKEELNTILSQRAYLTDAAFTVAAIVPDAESELPFDLDEIAQALARPQFVLSAGRKACPLSLPPSACVINAPDLPQALAAYDAQEDAAPARSELRRALIGAGEGEATIVLDAAYRRDGLEGTINMQRVETRRDMPIDRARWRFGPREEHIGVLMRPIADAASAGVA